MNLWERLPGEPPKGFFYWGHYRDLGPARSIEKTARIVGGLPVDGRGRPPGCRYLERLSSRWHWKARAEAWDSEVDRMAREANAKRLIDARERHAEMAAGALAALSAPIRAAVEALSADAVEALRQAAAADPKALLSLLDVVARHSYAVQGLIAAERIALGMNDKPVPEGDGPVPEAGLKVYELSRLSNSELDTLIALLSKASKAEAADDVMTEILRRDPEYRAAVASALQRATTRRDES